MILIYEKGMNKGPIQIGTGIPITINQVAQNIIKLNNKNLNLINDLSKPEGDFGRLAIIDKAKDILDWEPKISFEEGLKITYEWLIKKLST